jgi:N-formylglutamate deformylase
MEPFRFRAGTAPLLVSMPHVGTYIPAELAARMTDGALFLPDTDWHLERLYDFLDALGASVLVATHSRYVVDLNRPPDDANLYPGQDTTGLVPIDTFARTAVYRDGALPTATEIGARVERHWQPYHAQLAQELERLRAGYGYALLWDAHSIASEVPRFFAGRLPDLNLGTAGGASCAPAIEAAVATVARAAQAYSSVLNGRFKGGYITRRCNDRARVRDRRAPARLHGRGAALRVRRGARSAPSTASARDAGTHAGGRAQRLDERLDDPVNPRDRPRARCGRTQGPGRAKPCLQASASATSSATSRVTMSCAFPVALSPSAIMIVQ